MPEDAAETAARAALIALRACLPHASDVSTDHYVLLPSVVPLPMSAAVAALAKMPKPLTCVAFATMQVLAVAVWTKPEERLAYMRDGREELTQLRNHYAGPDTRLLVRGGGEEVLLSSSALEQWYLGYDLMLANSSTDKPDAFALARGADAVTTFHPAGIGGIHGWAK